MSTSSTTSISSMLNSKNRVFGLSSGSGMDVDSLVEKLMQAEEEKVNKVKQQKTYLEWQKDAYREVTTSLTSLKNTYLNITSSTNLLSSSAINKYKTTASDTTVVSATANSTVGEATHTVSVSQVAKVGSTSGKSYLESPTVKSITTTQTMADFTGKTTDDVVLTIGSQNYKFKSGETIEEFCTRISSDATNNTYNLTATATGITATLKTVDTETVPTQNVTGTFLTKAGMTVDVDTTTVSSFTGVSDGNTVLTIDGTDYKATSGEKISTFLSRVNNANSSYRISYDESANKFVVTTKNTGVDTGSASGAFLTAANLTTKAVTNTTTGTTTNVLDLGTNCGQNAKFTIDGITCESTSNKYTLGGVTYNILGEGTSNVDTARDEDTIVKNLQSFVTDYNKIIDNLNTKLTEKKYRDYTPLTDEQKDEMKDSDITLWEAKAKSGMLRGDTLLSGFADKLKQTMYTDYTMSDGTKMSLSDIGIGTTSYEDKGKLTIDETKLKEALEENPDKVAELLTKESSTDYDPDGGNSKRESENGVFANISDILNDYVRTNRDSDGYKGLLLQKAGTTDDASEYDNAMDKLIDEKDDQISDLLDKLDDKQDYYYKKFTAMETAITKLNSQTSSLSSMLG